MNKNIVETITGGLVIIVALWFVFVFLNKTSDIRADSSSYNIIAKFDNVSGVEDGTSVMIGGVKIGVVLEKSLDPTTYSADITMAINDKIKIPEDSSASITSSGLLGEKYISISPGADEKMLAQNGQIKYTQSSVNLETLIGKMMFNSSKDDKK